jgi:hypothetical protein
MLVEPLEKYLKHNEARYYEIRRVIGEGIIAGGAARQIFLGEDFGSTDVDFYFSSRGLWDAWYRNLNRGYDRYHRSHKAAGFMVEDTKCQLIQTHFSSNPQEIFDSFDLTCCMFAIKDHELYYTEEAAEHASKKMMVFKHYDNSRDPYKRVGKYLKKGFIPSCLHSEKILQEFLQYIEEEYKVYDPQLKVQPYNRNAPINLFDTFADENYRSLRPDELEDQMENIFHNFFGYSSEDY